VKKKIFYFYKESKKILADNNATVITHSIDILNFPYCFHENFIEKKEKIIKKNFFQILLYIIFCIGLNILIWITAYLKHIGKKKSFYYFRNKAVIVSHFLDSESNKYNPKKDWVFSQVYKSLKKKLGDIKFVLFNHTNLNEDQIFSDVIFIKKILNFNDEFKILIHQIKETKNIFFNFFLRKKIKFITFLHILSSIYSLETRKNIRFYVQFKKIQNKNKIKYLFFTYEGMAWEKMLIYASREVNLECMLIGYQFSYIPKNAFWIELKNKKYCPDYIFTCGDFNKKKILSKNIFYKKKIFNVGSNRYFYIKKKTPNKLNCLIMPKGTFIESKSMIILTLSLAKLYPFINFVIRSHPFINLQNFIKKNLNEEFFNMKNIIISKKNLKKDIQLANFAIYRGSASILSAIINNVIPIYFKYLDNKNNIDPIFDSKIEKFIIKNEYEFKNILASYNFFNKKVLKKNKKIACNIYSKFEKKDISNFYKNLEHHLQ